MIRIAHEGVIWRACVEAPDDGSPARKVVTGRRHRLTGAVPSHKSLTSRDLVWESPNELWLVQLESFNPETAFIVAQPHTLHAWTDGREFRHTPDFLLGRTTAYEPAEVVEVKPQELIGGSSMLQILRISEACHRALGFDFSIRTITESGVRQKLANCRYLLRYQKVATRPSLVHTVVTLFVNSEKPFTIQACVAGIDGQPETRFELYALACMGLIDFDLTIPLGPETRIVNTKLPPMKKN